MLSGAVVFLAAAAYVGYRGFVAGPETFTVDATEAPKRSIADLTRPDVVQGGGPVAPAASAPAPKANASRGAATADVEMEDIEWELERSRAVAPIRPYTDTVHVPLALVASPEVPDGSARPQRKAEATVMAHPVRAIPSDTPANAFLRQLLERWQQAIRDGKPSPDLGSASFKDAVESSSLSCPLLYAIGRSVGFIEGDAAAAVFYRVALVRAEQQLGSTGQRSPQELAATADALYGMADELGLRLKDYAASERLCELLRRYESGNPAGQRKATILLARAMRMQGQPKSAQAAELLQGMLQEKLSADERTEVLCELAQLRFDAGNCKEVSELLMQWDRHDLNTACVERGWVLLIRSAAASGRVKDARALYSQWRRKAGPKGVLPLDPDTQKVVPLD